MPEFVLVYQQSPCWMYLCSESPALAACASPALASCCRSTADQRGCLCRLHTPRCWIFFFISLLLQTSWQEVNGLLARQSLLPHQGEAAWPDVRHPLFEHARGDAAAGRAPLLTFAVVRAQAAPTERSRRTSRCCCVSTSPLLNCIFSSSKRG